MRPLKVGICLLLALVFAGCWDRIEVEDQLFPVTLAVDKGERQRYRVMVRVPISSAMRAGILGGQGIGVSQSTENLSAEAETLTQSIYILNTSVARRLNFRHVRGIVIGEDLAREGLDDLWAELMRNGEFRENIAVFVSRGSAVETLEHSRPTGEYNPGKINEGLMLVLKQLHMGPPTRLHHMVNRTAAEGTDPFAPVVALNRRIMGQPEEADPAHSAIAGELDRMGKNPMEVAGTAIFRHTKLAGFLNVDQTQALLALRGEMGKAYVTIPNPLQPGERLMLRYQQENLPQHDADFTPEGPRVHVKILFEGEVLSGKINLRNPENRKTLERSSSEYFRRQIEEFLDLTREWEADPVGYGLLFRNRFATWQDWHDYNWRRQIRKLKVTVDVRMRIRRFGLVVGTKDTLEE